MNPRVALLGSTLLLLVSTSLSSGAEVLPPASRRFAADGASEVPDFQRHLLPLMGRLGCNTRSCHGSFQGRGGFRLSLFGYDFKADHEALLKSGAERVVVDNPEASKIIAKPTLNIPHKGGKRMEEGSWQYQMFVRWVESGAKGVSNASRFERLEVIPTEVVFQKQGEKVPLKVIAHWADGTREDVTCLSRFRTNDESIAEVDADGMITSQGKGDTHVVAFYDNGVAVTQVLRPVSDQVGPKYPEVASPTPIDTFILAKLRKLGIVPAEVCSDAEFLRRVSLDMTGTLPTPEEVSTFLADSSPGKREKKVDELLSRPTYAAWWTDKLCDITGNSPRYLQFQQGTTDQPARFWYDWIYRRVKDNMPYDELVAKIVLATSRRPGQTYDDYIKEETAYFREKDPTDYSQRETMPYFWARRNVLKPEEKALAFSYTFLGVRLECAQCHKHPFDQWTQDDFNQFTAFFRPIVYGYKPEKPTGENIRKLNESLGLVGKDGGERQRILAETIKAGKEIPWREVFIAMNRARVQQPNQAKNTQAKAGRVITPKLLGGEVVSFAGLEDPRASLMEWMRRQDNPYFARAFVNRVWATYFGSGVIDPPDDMNLANPPSNPALLDYLAAGFVSHGYDMKWLHREIVSSHAYQRSWQTNETNRLDERNFSRAVIRRLPAEVLVDAVSQATASSSDLLKLARVADDRAIGPRGTPGMRRRAGSDYASRVFGRTIRETNCDCSRSNEPNLLQSIYLQNDQEVLAAIERGGGWVAESAGAIVKAKNAGSVKPADVRAVKVLTDHVNDLDNRLRSLREDDDEDQAKTLQARRKTTFNELDALKRKIAEAKKLKPAPAADVTELVREAYLRTLSRRPDAREIDVARAHFARSTDEVKGLRDLLWALLNTKEFITNH